MERGSERSEPTREDMTEFAADGKRLSFADGGAAGSCEEGVGARMGGGEVGRRWGPSCGLALGGASGSVSVLCVFEPEE